MSGPDIGLSRDDEPCLLEGGEEFVPGSQCQMFGEIGEQEPTFSARLQVGGQPTEESIQHPAFGIVDRLFKG